MHAFERSTRHQRVLAVNPEQERAFDHQKWPKSLASPEARIAHGVKEPPRTGEFLADRGLGQEPVEQRLGILCNLVEAILKFRCRVHTSPCRVLPWRKAFTGVSLSNGASPPCKGIL